MIAQIDSDLGISVYSTNSKGCGGKIRTEIGDFQVSEIISKKTLDSISQNPGFPVYKLTKNNIDTTHALNDIFRKHRQRLKSLGLKDASASTEQFVYSIKKSNPLSSISEKRYTLERLGFVKKPLSKKTMIGNHFKIKIHNTESDFSNFDEYNKILNFFGYQRFGSKRPITHLIGKAVIQKKFQNAIDFLLSFTSKYDSKENTELRQKLSDKSNYSKIVKEIPHQMDLEKKVVEQLIEHDNPVKAFNTLPLSIRRFFIQAYQSFIFNHTLSLAFQDGEDLFFSQTGDVCFDKNGILGKFLNDPEQKLAIPIVGYGYYKKTRFDYQISKILKSEQVTAKDFF